jgi:hypothetical protein
MNMYILLKIAKRGNPSIDLVGKGTTHAKSKQIKEKVSPTPTQLTQKPYLIAAQKNCFKVLTKDKQQKNEDGEILEEENGKDMHEEAKGFEVLSEDKQQKNEEGEILEGKMNKLCMKKQKDLRGKGMRRIKNPLMRMPR